MKKFMVITLGIFLAINATGQDWKSFQYQSGDLLFQDIDCGGLCDAIESVTPGVGNKHFSHIGLAYVMAGSVWVIEAIGKDVHLTPLDDFLQRQLDSNGNPKVMVGRLKNQYRQLNTKAISFALQQKGTPYDDTFLYNNGKYYCSELVYDAFKYANDGDHFFNLYPMTFKDPKTGKTMPVWKKYYKKLRRKIPEGKPGCNPGSIAISTSVEIVASFY